MLHILHSKRVWKQFRNGYLYPHYPLHTGILKSEEEKNSNTYLNLVKMEKTQIEIGSGEHPKIQVLLTCRHHKMMFG